ncbi:hypothetical protein HRG_001908 [Hirsutella rhossiliensis]|uniref:BTB domain-containing protein n=1 Tax=Hirsutella rhossiliensis TaxID=111463 RepID=A0A9P8SLQ0_9HYPO|nr:uncharacterized protein HRG_01908 [Hirsutella rhossiliensis]KAH0966499.1 hypothetical protein HRG_01908 [Hirsutella rhossiliensis]
MSQATPPSTNTPSSAATPKARPLASKKRKAEAETNMSNISDYSHLGGSPEYSHLTFACNGHEFNVHKAVVLPHSAVLRAAVQGRFLEAQTNVVFMDGFSPRTVRQRMREHMHVNAIADYYGIPALEKLANDNLRAIIQPCVAKENQSWFPVAQQIKTRRS